MRWEAPQTLRRHAPRKRGIQYAAAFMQASEHIKIVGEYWIARLRGQ
jgi:hypothetical protein